MIADIHLLFLREKKRKKQKIVKFNINQMTIPV